MSADVGILEDQCTLEVPKHARRDISGERGWALRLRDVVRSLLIYLLRVEVYLGGRRGRRF